MNDTDTRSHMPTNERLYALYGTVSREISDSDVKAILERAGTNPTGQEVKDVRHRITQILSDYVDDLFGKPSPDTEEADE